MTWQSTGISIRTLPPGGLREVMLGSRSVLLLHAEGAVRATEAICPHIGGLLADGTLAGSRLTCPEHGAIFDVRNGKVVADPFGVEPPEGAVEAIATYPVRVVAEMIEVDVP